MTPAVFKNRYMKNNLFKKYKKEPFESFETLFESSEILEKSYEMPEVLDSEIKEAIVVVLSTLTPREEKVLRMRFGIGLNTDYTLEEVAQHLSVTRERIRQIEAVGLRKIRETSRVDILKNVA
tara:strand:- start:156 stop:524 length:369 start_codon:yes stop_codon:yes gene_type:complete